MDLGLKFPLQLLNVASYRWDIPFYCFLYLLNVLVLHFSSSFFVERRFVSVRGLCERNFSRSYVLILDVNSKNGEMTFCSLQ